MLTQAPVPQASTMKATIVQGFTIESIIP